MATINPVITRIKSNGERSFVISWENLTENDTAAPVELAPHADRSVQMTGSFGAGTVSLEGSNDGVTYAVLEDLGGSAISFSTASLQGVGPLTRYIRPSTPTGTSVDVDVTVLASGGFR